MERDYTKLVRESFAALEQVVDACWTELQRKPSARKLVLRNLRSTLYDDAQTLVLLLRDIQANGLVVEDSNGDSHRILDAAIEVSGYIDRKLAKGLKLV